MDALVLIFAAGAVACGAGCLLLRFGRRIARLSDAFVRLPAAQKAILVLGVTVATVSAQKGVTNGAGVASFSYGRFVAGGVAPLSGAAVSPADAARGYRLESVSTNDDLSCAMPEGAATVGTWRLTGAYDDVVRVRLDGQEDSGAPAFRFPLGRSLCDALWAFTWGRVRPQLRNASNEIAVVGAPMSAIPGVSRLWTAATADGSRLLAWEDFALGRLPAGVSASVLSNALVSARLELFPSGDFVARSNGVERVYRRVNPDDWDGDGISNERDGDPYVRADGDGGFGPHQDLSFTANTNAYCWVELVVRRANARVTFVGDGPSDLPDPDFIAEAGATNRVTLLIGKEYRVSCAMPVEVAGKSSGNLEDYRDEDGAIRLRWPVTVAAQGDGEEMSLLLSAARLAAPRRRGFTMRVVPSGLGGSFTWTNCCCSISGSGYAYSYNCGEDCTCGGCAALGYLAYEGYRLPAYGGNCGCGSQGEDEPQISVVEPCGVEATEVGVADQGLKPGQAGGVMLRQMLCVLPLDVSFSQIKIEEVPNVGGSNEGYFSDVYFRYEWLHGLEQGAGEWHEVDEDNIFLWDHAGLRCALPQLDNTGIVSETGTNGWKSGTLTWQVPCGWSDSKATEGESPYGTFADDALQVISIDSDGNCKVRKHGNVARRDIDGKLYLNGDLVK